MSDVFKERKNELYFYMNLMRDNTKGLESAFYTIFNKELHKMFDFYEHAYETLHEYAENLKYEIKRLEKELTFKDVKE